MAEQTETTVNAEETGGETLAAVLDKKNEQIPHEVVSSEKKEHSRIQYAVKIPADTFNIRVDEVLRDLQRQAAVPGFRKGKAPINLVRNRFGKNAREEAVRKMVPRLAEIVAEEQKVETLAQPVFDGWQAGDNGEATLQVTLEVRPDINITDDTLKDINIEATENPVSEEKVNEELDRLRDRNATYEAADDAVFAEGDAMTFTIDVYDAGTRKRIPEYSAIEHYSQSMGQELPAAVLEEIIGKKKGDLIEVDNVDLPQPEKEPLKISVKLQIHEIKKRNLPELDDEFAKDVSEDFGGIDDLKAQIRQDLESSENSRQRNEKLTAIFAILRDRLEFDIPPSLIQHLADQSVMKTEKQLNQYGLSLQSMTRDYVHQYLHKAQHEAVTEAKNVLIMEQLARHLDIETTEEMLDAEIQRIADIQGRRPLAIRAQLEAQKRLQQFRADLRLKTVSDRLVEMANVTIVEKIEAPAEPEESPEA